MSTLPRTPDVALRRALPALNADTRAIQERLEDIGFLLRIPQRKPFNTMADDVEIARGVRTAGGGGGGGRGVRA